MTYKFLTRSRIITLSIILGITAGLLDSIIDTTFFYHDHLFDEIFRPTKFEIYIRSFIFLIFLLSGVVASIIVELLQTKGKQEKAITELKKDIAVLEEFLPICSSCKQILDDKGEWHQLEQYITDHTGTLFSHGLCPECAKKVFREHDKLKN
jgi:endogenous inhibitor of DNA gyrase (YacG/DUF329 family)